MASIGRRVSPECSGEADGELDDLLRARLDAGVADELRGREHLLEQHAELDFGEAAAGFDVGEDAGEAVDAFGEFGHLAEAGVDLVELVGDLAEGLGEAGVQGGVELFIDRGAHLFEPGGVVGVELRQAGFDGGAETFLVGDVGLGEVVQLGVEGVLLVELGACRLGAEMDEALVERPQGAVYGRAEGFGGVFVVDAELAESLGEGLAEALHGAKDFRAEPGGGFVLRRPRVLGLMGEILTELGELAGQGALERFAAGVEAGELVGDGGVARIWLRHGRHLRLTQEQRDGEEDEDGFEGEDGQQHIRILFATG